ncbi:MAG TPA: sialate O-acetylesterase, partial [Polyangiaceae bacterium]|nr:sialate O-acetylesterase [Polyangiaceae bacterium]
MIKHSGSRIALGALALSSCPLWTFACSSNTNADGNAVQLSATMGPSDSTSGLTSGTQPSMPSPGASSTVPGSPTLTPSDAAATVDGPSAPQMGTPVAHTNPSPSSAVLPGSPLASSSASQSSTTQGSAAEPIAGAPTATATSTPEPDASAAGGTGNDAPGYGGAGSGGAAGDDSPITSGGQGSTSTPTFHVFLLLGQSNMAGYAKAQAADKEKDERIRVLGFDECTDTGRHTDQWDVAVPPLHECWNGALGPGDYFAKTLIEELPEGDTIGLVPCAISGEKIETFQKQGGSKYDWIVQRAKLAQQEGGVIDGMLFHQGESNSGDGTWPGKVANLVSDLRADLG